MAMSSALTPLRALLTLRRKTLEINKDVWSNYTRVRQYRSKSGAVHKHRHSPPETADKGGPDLLREFPQPKNLLYATVSRALGLSDVNQFIEYSCSDGELKRATVTLHWPVRMETVGFGVRRTDAERRAAAAALGKLRELGVLGQGKQASATEMTRAKGRRASVWEDEEENLPVHHRLQSLPFQKKTHKDTAVGPTEEDPAVAEALSIFPKPRSLLNSVVQVATSSCHVRELLQYRTSGGKLKTCVLSVRWPEPMTFTAHGRRRLEAETRAAALACVRFKELNLLDGENKPLTHARYHQDAVREAGERHRRPCRIQIPRDLEQRIQTYLAQYPAEAEVQKLWDEDEQHLSVQSEEDDYEDEDLITDAITNKPYRPLRADQQQRLSQQLLALWEGAGPSRGAELPIDTHKRSILSAVRSSRVVVIAGETGCGKTTRVPRLLLEEQVLSGDGAACNILVTQPRRISAVSVAHRVAQEMGPDLRHCVGYQVRLESRPPERSGGALLFLTVGVLLRKLQSNPGLRGISHVVVDEVHERDVNTDLLLALLRSALQENPNLRVLLMSATGDTQRLSQYFSGCPVVHVPGFMHPVQERFLEEVMMEMGRRLPDQSLETRRQEEHDVAPDLDLVSRVIDHIHRTGEPGAVLCFLPGWQEIKAVQQNLEEKAAYKSGSQMILPLHSSMAVSEQQAVFQRPPNGQRKIVLATNIAETSITIDDIVHVVDAGCQKEQNYDPRTKVSGLNTVYISRSNVTQRRGRAGRCQPGHSYHLFPRKLLDSMDTFPIPEILRTPLESVVMQAKIHCPDSKAVDFLSQVLDSPDTQAVKVAVKNLMEIGVLDASESLTPLGQCVSCMSCDPRLGKVLVLSAVFSCVLPMLSVVACLTRDPFYNSMQNRALIAKAKADLSGSSCSDHLVFSRVVQGWREQTGRDSRQEFLDKHTLSGASLRFIHGLMQQFSENLSEAGLVDHPAECLRPSSHLNQNSHQDELLSAVLLAGLYPNLIQVKKGTVTKGGRFRPENQAFRTESGPVLLHRSSVNRGKPDLWSRWLTFFSAVKSSGQVFVRDSSVVHPLALLLLTDGDLSERAVGERVEVALPGRSLIRWEFAPHVWDLLWDLRASLQALLYRRLQTSHCGSGSRVRSGSERWRDEELVSLLLELLTRTRSDDACDPDPPTDSTDSDR